LSAQSDGFSSGCEKNPALIVRFAEFRESSLNFELYFWAHIFERWMAISDLNFAIVKIFRENSLEIPFPQRDLNIRSEKSVENEYTSLVNKDENLDLEDPQIDG